MQETRHQFHEQLRGLEGQALDGLELVGRVQHPEQDGIGRQG